MEGPVRFAGMSSSQAQEVTLEPLEVGGMSHKGGM